jgi:hypothetical protein
MRRSWRTDGQRVGPMAGGPRSTHTGGVFRVLPLQPSAALSPGTADGRWTLDTSPVYLAMDLMSRVFSPHDLNPTGFNPLRRVLTESIDFERLVTSPIKLFITATNVHAGRGRIFRNSQITPEVLLASACLPTMFGAVEIEASPIGTVVSPEIPPSRLCESARYHPGSDQSAGAPEHTENGRRYPGSTQRNFLQRAALEGTAYGQTSRPEVCQNQTFDLRASTTGIWVIWIFAAPFRNILGPIAGRRSRRR